MTLSLVSVLLQFDLRNERRRIRLRRSKGFYVGFQLVQSTFQVVSPIVTSAVREAKRGESCEKTSSTRFKLSVSQFESSKALGYLSVSGKVYLL